MQQERAFRGEPGVWQQYVTRGEPKRILPADLKVPGFEDAFKGDFRQSFRKEAVFPQRPGTKQGQQMLNTLRHKPQRHAQRRSCFAGGQRHDGSCGAGALDGTGGELYIEQGNCGPEFLPHQVEERAEQRLQQSEPRGIRQQGG